jgi:hypothetical protein
LLSKTAIAVRAHPPAAVSAPPPFRYAGAKLEEDTFGKAMLDCGIPKETILKWTKDPQV